jgi:hypothetical protein
LIVRFDDVLRRNLTDRGIGTAIEKLQSSSDSVRDRFRGLNPRR